jgi:hypothetical protein
MQGVSSFAEARAMSEFMQAIVVVLTYRVVTVLCGTLIIFLGYRLFRIGVFEKAGDLKGVWGDKRLVLKQGAPGTFFVVFGAIIVSVSIWKGVDLETIRSRTGTNNPSITERQIGGDSLAFPWPNMPNTIGISVPADVRVVIEKVATGEGLTDADRKLLAGWNEKVKKFEEEERMRLKAWQPPVRDRNEVPG